MMILIFAIAAGCIIAEWFWPALELPRVRAWWPRVVLVNTIQLGLTIVVGHAWHRWVGEKSFLDLRDHFSPWSSALIAYFLSTFVYYWWHRLRHESVFFWRLCHQLHHSPRRLEIVTSFYKHPVEIMLNAFLSSALVYALLGCSVEAGAIYTLLTAVAEFFYHWNIRTPYWLGFLVQRPESHRLHHQYRNHTNNFADLPIWDWLFGTFKNPRGSGGRCGFDAWREERFEDMLAFRDVNSAAADERTPLSFLPTCIGCSKRWACTSAREAV
jgi:sterol desaturase/sphingolipid hydroxylase (fatty acid hydroxylase superfamily)